MSWFESRLQQRSQVTLFFTVQYLNKIIQFYYPISWLSGTRIACPQRLWSYDITALYKYVQNYYFLESDSEKWPDICLKPDIQYIPNCRP